MPGGLVKARLALPVARRGSRLHGVSRISLSVSSEHAGEGMTGDPTTGGIRDPVIRLQKLIERRQHIEDTIAELQDKHYIIESEIATLKKR